MRTIIRPAHAAYPSGPGLVLGLAALLPLAFLAVFFVLPVGGMLARGFLPDGRLDLSGVPEVLGRARALRVLWFTLWSSAAGTAGTLLLGLPTAYVLHRLRFPGRGLLRAVVIMPFVLPTVVVGVMFRSLLSTGGPLGFLGLDGTWVPILLAFVFFNLAVVVRTVGGMWEGLDRRAEESAATLGATPWQVWRTVTLPALAPAVVSAATLVFLFCSTAFGVVLTLGGLRYGTVETEIYLLTTQFLDLQGAARHSQDGELVERLGGAVAELDQTIRDIRATIFELRHHPGAGSFRADLRQLVESYASTLGFAPVVHLRGPLDTVADEEVHTQVLMVVREALSNVARHARATSVVVTAEVVDDPPALRLVVRDDGVGIGEEVAESGLGNVRARAADRGGAVSLRRVRPHGTELSWSVPL